MSESNKDSAELGVTAADIAATTAPTAEARPCTCHPDDNPPQPCAQKYALSECKAAEPVGYFIQIEPGRIEQAADEYKGEPDVFPLYRYPPDHTEAVRAALEKVIGLCDENHDRYLIAAIRALSPEQIIESDAH